MFGRTRWIGAVLLLATIGSGSPAEPELVDGACGTLCTRWCNEYRQCWCECPIVTATE